MHNEDEPIWIEIVPVTDTKPQWKSRVVNGLASAAGVTAAGGLGVLLYAEKADISVREAACNAGLIVGGCAVAAGVTSAIFTSR